jgi:hypothetical protein
VVVELDPLSAVHLRAEGNRINLPEPFSDYLAFTGDQDVNAWLFLLCPGRYRLLTDQQARRDQKLEPLCSLVSEGKYEITADSSQAFQMTRASLAARLVLVSVHPPKPAWRFTFPKAFEPFTPPDCDATKFSLLVSLEGYCELWHTDVLRGIILSLPDGENPFPG